MPLFVKEILMIFLVYRKKGKWYEAKKIHMFLYQHVDCKYLVSVFKRTFLHVILLHVYLPCIHQKSLVYL